MTSSSRPCKYWLITEDALFLNDNNFLEKMDGTAEYQPFSVLKYW